MTEKLNKQSAYNIEPEKLHSFFVHCDRVNENFAKIIDYATQLSILSNAYYYEDYDSETVINCISMSIDELYKSVCNENEMICTCEEIYNDMLNL